MKKNIKNVYEIGENKKHSYNYMYVLKPSNIKEMNLLYESFAHLDVDRMVCEKNGVSLLRVLSEEPIEDINDIVSNFELFSLDFYKLIDSWKELKSRPITFDERRKIFTRLCELERHNVLIDKIPKVLAVIGALGFGLAAFFLNIWPLYIGIVLFPALMFFIRYKLNEEEKKFKISRSVSNEEWSVCECNVCCSDIIVHRGDKKQPLEEKVFYLAQGDYCIRTPFTGLEFNFKENINLFIRTNATDEEVITDAVFEDGQQVYFFNGSYLTIPASYEIPENLMKLLLWHENKEREIAEKMAALEEEKRLAEEKKKLKEQGKEIPKEIFEKEEAIKKKAKPVKAPKEKKEKEEYIIVTDIRKRVAY